MVSQLIKKLGCQSFYAGTEYSIFLIDVTAILPIKNPNHSNYLPVYHSPYLPINNSPHHNVNQSTH